MIRKITLVFLLCIGFQTILRAQAPDSVSIYLPYGADTTCPGTQLTFTAIETNPSYSATVTYHWYTDNIITGVIVDTFYTTALVDGDSVYCKIFYIGTTGFLDSFQSNTIIIHRSDTIPPRVHIALTAGSNPDCNGHPLTFTAYPVNGGSSPIYNWIINNALIPGADSITFTRVFSAGDTISCQMISNSTCAAPNDDTVVSTVIPVIHDSLTAYISIVVNQNPICLGTHDTFTATIADEGIGSSLTWYVDSALIPGALGNQYLTDSLHNGSVVYCILNAPDPCVINDTTVSNVITMTVITPLNNSVDVTLTAGANPGCVQPPNDSVTYTATFNNFGVSPTYVWYVNGQPVDSNKLFIDSAFENGDILSFQVRATDSGCYVHDTITFPSILMIRDSTPTAPWISLIGDMLVGDSGGVYSWYGPPTGSLIAGAITSTYHPTLLGTYYARRDTANCESDTSNFIYISLLEINSINNWEDVKIYPNPTSGMLNLDWGNRAVNMRVDVYNVLGQELIHEVVINQSHHETDMSSLRDGNYFVVLRDQDGSKRTFKVLLAR